MNTYTEWIPALAVASIVVAVALLWIGIELYQIRQYLTDRAARATRIRDRINAYTDKITTAARLSPEEMRDRWKRSSNH